MTNEAAIVEGLRAGDPRAFDLAWLGWNRRIFGFLLRMTGHRSIAEELLQETFLRLARHATRLAPDTRLSVWLFCVARNLTRSWRRWSWVDGDRMLRIAAGWLGAPSPPSPLEELARDEAQRRLERAVGELPERLREVVLLLTVEGMSVEEAASVLELTPEAIRQRFSRAKARIAELGGPT